MIFYAITIIKLRKIQNILALKIEHFHIIFFIKSSSSQGDFYSLKMAMTIQSSSIPYFKINNRLCNYLRFCPSRTLSSAPHLLTRRFDTTRQAFSRPLLF